MGRHGSVVRSAEIVVAPSHARASPIVYSPLEQTQEATQNGSNVAQLKELRDLPTIPKKEVEADEFDDSTRNAYCLMLFPLLHLPISTKIIEHPCHALLVCSTQISCAQRCFAGGGIVMPEYFNTCQQEQCIG